MGRVANLRIKKPHEAGERAVKRPFALAEVPGSFRRPLRRLSASHPLPRMSLALTLWELNLQVASRRCCHIPSLLPKACVQGTHPSHAVPLPGRRPVQRHQAPSLPLSLSSAGRSAQAHWLVPRPRPLSLGNGVRSLSLASSWTTNE